MEYKGSDLAGNAGVVCVSQVHCKKVLGTDDPDQVQKQLKDWDKFDQVAQKMNAAGYKMLSGYDDSYRAFSNNVSHPWVVGNKIVIDENIKKWIRQTKEYAQKIITIIPHCGVRSGRRIRDRMGMFLAFSIRPGALILL